MREKRVAYILSRFPVLTETFIIGEIQEFRQKGIEVEVFSLKGPKRNETLHSNSEELIRTTHYYPFLFSTLIWKSIFYYLRTKPLLCLTITKKVITTHIGNPVLLLKTLAVIPKTFTIAKVLKEMGICKVHAHWATIPTTAAWIIAKLNNITYTFTAHAWDIYQVDTMLREKMRDAARIITISNYNKTYLVDKFPEIDLGKITVIHCGLDFKKFNPRPITKGDPFKIISVGRLTEKKGIHILLKACKILKDRKVPVVCHIVYVNGNYQDEVFRLYSQLDLNDFVKFIPELSQEEIINLYSNSDCFVLPCLIAGSNDRDGIPVVILEALAMELPVVTTPVSGIPEVIKNNETGLLVSPQNIGELAEAIERLYSDIELRERLGKAGKDLVHEEFEISASVDLLISTIFN